MARPTWLYLICIFIGLGLGVIVIAAFPDKVTATLAESQPESAPQFAIAVPASLEELVGRADLVVIATVEEILTYTWGPLTRGGLSLTDGAGGLVGGIPVTDYRLQVETVIRDDGAIARGNPFVMREIGHGSKSQAPVRPDSAFPPSRPGERYLFLLGYLPYWDVYDSVYGPRGRLIIDGDLLRISNGARDLLTFEDHPAPVTLVEMMRFIQDADKTEALTPQPAQPVSPIATPAGARVRGTADQYGAPPYNLYELVPSQTLVVIATVGLIARYTVACEAASETSIDECPADLLEPVTDFELKVEQVIRDSGSVAYGDPIRLREHGYITAESKQLVSNEGYAASYTGDRYLFILYPVDDQGTFVASHGVWGRLIIDGDNVRLSNATHDPLRFDDGGQVTFKQLIEVAQRPW